MGAFNAVILTWLATRWGFPATFGRNLFYDFVPDWALFHH
jgi:hypothetical protein